MAPSSPNTGEERSASRELLLVVARLALRSFCTTIRPSGTVLDPLNRTTRYLNNLLSCAHIVSLGSLACTFSAPAAIFAIGSFGCVCPSSGPAQIDSPINKTPSAILLISLLDRTMVCRTQSFSEPGKIIQPAYLNAH